LDEGNMFLYHGAFDFGRCSVVFWIRGLNMGALNKS
jgi:hypothetical protein